MPKSTRPSEQQLFELSRYRVRYQGRGQTTAETTRALREAIFDGALKPGQWLREDSLATALDVSRTPLREAMNRLEEEGLIVREPGSGARVVSLTHEDMVVIYQVRGSLESVAASIAARNATEEDLESLGDLDDRMSDAAEAEDAPLFHDLNIRFHRRLADAATNAYLRRLLSTVETAIRLVGTRTYTVERMREIVDEHRTITAAISARDPQAASAASLSHAEHARRTTLARMLSSLGEV